MPPVRLLVVGTPIGNLADLSPRAAAALREADLVVAEDTRVTARLLRHVSSGVPTISFNEHNAAARLPGLLDRLARGETLALTTDAGMPAISDPGARLVAGARAAGHRIQVVPGPSAVVAAMAMAGVEAPGFVFGGFLPGRRGSARRDRLRRLLDAASGTGLPLVLFEAPHRLTLLIAELAGEAPDAVLAVGRELTKLHEEVRVGTADELAADPPVARGEMTVVISAIAGRAPAATHPFDPNALAASAVAGGLGERAAVEMLRSAGIGRREAYRAVRAAATLQRGAPRSGAGGR